MTLQEQQKEIERLQRKVRNLTTAYHNAVKELEELKQEMPVRSKGRPAIDVEKKARVLALYRKGHSMRSIGEQVQLAAGTVHKIISQATADSRSIYVYMDRQQPATILDVCAATRRIEIVNLTDDMVSRAFGIREHPTWEDYEEFLESRCMPRTRFGIREELKYMGIDAYDPYQIVEKTKGRVYGDGQWLKRMSRSFTADFDAVMKEVRTAEESERRRRLLELLEESKGQVMYDESES